MISVNARNLRTLQVITLLKGKKFHTMCGLCEELRALAGNKAINKVLQVLKFTFRMDGCESKAFVENAFRRLGKCSWTQDGLLWCVLLLI